MRAYSRRNRIGEVGRQVVERRADDLAKPPGSNAADGLVDRNDAADLEGFRSPLVGFGRAGPGRISQQFKLRLNDLQLTGSLIFFDFPVKGDHLAGCEFVLQISRIEPETAQTSPALPDRELKDRFAPRTEQPGVTHFSDYAGHFSGTQFGDPTRVQPVLVAKRKIMEQVADSVDPLGSQDLGNTRSNAFDILNRGGKFEHALNSWEGPP